MSADAGLGPDYWERLLRATPYYETVEKLRDAVDNPGWREREAAKAAAERQRGDPPRVIPDSLGAVPHRAYRQVNVKLSEADFEVLSNLALERDIAVSTMARVLLRHAALAEAGAAPTWRP